MHADAGGGAIAGTVEHGGPEQGVEVDDVLADKVVKLRLRVPLPEGIEVQPFPVAQVLEAGHVADGGIQPDVEILARRAGNLETEVGGVAADIPFPQATLQPLVKFVGGFLGHVAGADPVFQEIDKIREFEKIVGRRLFHRHGAGDGRAGIDQLGGGIGGAATFAVVPVLVVGAAAGAGTLDIAVGQEKLFFRVIGLGNFPAGNMAIVRQGPEYGLGKLPVFLGMGGVVIVERDMEVREIPLVAGLDLVDQLFGSDSQFFRLEHDGGTVGIVGTDVVTCVPPQLLEPDPDIGLDILHQVAEMDVAIGVGKRAGDENVAGIGHGPSV